MDAALRSAAQHEEATDQTDQAAAGEYGSNASQTGTHVSIVGFPEFDTCHVSASARA